VRIMCSSSISATFDDRVDRPDREPGHAPRGGGDAGGDRDMIFDKESRHHAAPFASAEVVTKCPPALAGEESTCRSIRCLTS
jgi:hypothetical protein